MTARRALATAYSTTPVTVWYVDHNGYMVRIQLE
jgi:hypothetical protein